MENRSVDFSYGQNYISYLKVNSNFLSLILEDYLRLKGDKEDFDGWCLDDFLYECEEKLGYNHCFKILDIVDDSWWEIL